MLALDHIILAAKDPQQAAEDFAIKHNINVLEGGKHEKWGTYNYLAYFSNGCYLEWLGIFDKDLAVQSENPLIDQLIRTLDSDVEGAIQYALGTDDMDYYLEHFRQENISFTGPIAGSRNRPDGSLLEWRMLFPQAEIIRHPFLIEWGDGKNVPSDPALINKQQIDTIFPVIANRDDFDKIFQTDHQLENVQLAPSAMMRFSISK
ncbi:VOC family protein [Virgibacillus siamensis]|uniref:VOC family protein n=1 Tax=Virgibacillus siamensis TaxID=480071 RepID=UPI000985CBE3|nr:VOC family protein [Virgibacillus siamensis]